MAKTNATLRCEISDKLAKLSNKDLVELNSIVDGYLNLQESDKAPEKANKPKGAKKDEKPVEYVKLHCIKGVPTNVWSRINHLFEDEYNGKWNPSKKKGAGYWSFSDTLKDDGEIDVPASEWCTLALESQVEYAKSKGIECAIGTLA